MKNKPVAKRQKERQPVRLNLNLRTRSNEKNAAWKHFQGLSFICEAKDELQAAMFAAELRKCAQALAIAWKMPIPGAIYIPKEEQDAAQERTTQANPA